METLVEKITDEHAAIDLGAVAAANIPDLPKQKSGTIRFIKKSAPVIASAAEADLISELVHQIENLKESDAKARLLALESAHEKTYFEIGGVLSVMQKGKWYDPCASLDEWVEKNTGMSRSKALALIQIYNAVAHSGITWAQVKHIEWTKLRAIAGVLNKENAVHWIGIASKHSRRELNELVQKHLRASGEAVADGTTATHIKTFRLSPIVIASPAYFSGRLSFGELMVVVGGFSQVNQSLRWFVDNFALLAEWRAALSRVIKFREMLLVSESGCEDAIRTIHLMDFPDHLKSRNRAVPKGKKALLDVIERDVA